LRLHFPDFSGQNGDEKVDIVFEETSQIEWKRKLIEAHEHFKANDSRFGCLSFAGKNDEAHIGLQAADFSAGVYRQAEETQAELGKPLEYERIVDLVLFKNVYPRGNKRYKLTYDLSNEAFKEMIRLLVDHEKKKKAQWRKHRIKGRIYYPEKEFDFRGYMGGLGAR